MCSVFVDAKLVIANAPAPVQRVFAVGASVVKGPGQSFVIYVPILLEHLADRKIDAFSFC